MKTLKNWEESFKKPRKNSWENAQNVWWQFEEIQKKVLGSSGENLKKYFRKFSVLFRKFKIKCAEVTAEIPKI